MRLPSFLGGFACAVALAATATASLQFEDSSLQFEASYQEQWFPGAADPSADTESDLWSLTLADGDCDISIDSVKITLPYAGQVYFDVTYDGTGQNNAYEFAPTSGAGDTGFSGVTGNTDGSTMIELSFSDFGAGESFDFSIDVDNGNAVVRGSNGNPPSYHDMVGGLVDVTYSSGGAQATEQFVFGAPGGVPSDSWAVAGGALACIPEPTATLTWSVMTAFVGCRLRRRKR